METEDYPSVPDDDITMEEDIERENILNMQRVDWEQFLSYSRKTLRGKRNIPWWEEKYYQPSYSNPLGKRPRYVELPVDPGQTTISFQPVAPGVVVEPPQPPPVTSNPPDVVRSAVLNEPKKKRWYKGRVVEFTDETDFNEQVERIRNAMLTEFRANPWSGNRPKRNK